MVPFAIVVGLLFVALSTASVALIVSISKGAAWQGSKLSLPVRSDDPEVIRHVHRASLPMVVALAFIAVAHGVTLLVLGAMHYTGSPQSTGLLGTIMAAGIVTCGGLIAVIWAYATKPGVKKQ